VNGERASRDSGPSETRSRIVTAQSVAHLTWASVDRAGAISRKRFEIALPGGDRSCSVLPAARGPQRRAGGRPRR